MKRLACILVSLFVSVYSQSSPSTAQSVNLWRLKALAKNNHPFVVQDSGTDLQGRPELFPEKWFTQPLDHFDNSSGTHWKQRYWTNSRHYQPGGPVIILDGGETSGEDRLPFLDTGIVEILTRATNGYGVVLEHRYYGKSVPVLNFTTDSLRWLNNAQAAADSANFMANVKFDDIDEDIIAPNTPWIYYGGSYAGARAAHMKVLYPELVYGAIASSGVTHATVDNWGYMDIIRLAADSKCSDHIVNSIKTIDTILALGPLARPLKNIFGLGELESDQDFVSVISSPLGSWQDKVWDPNVGSTEFDEFCEALSRPPMGQLEHSADIDKILHSGLRLDLSILNYAKYIKENVVSKCPEGDPIEDCFGTSDDEKYRENGLEQTWRLWVFQVCTEWGYFTPPPPDPTYPSMISRLIDLEYESRICRKAFPPGKHFVVPPTPDVNAVNVLGDFSIAADRLAIIDGEVDPWRSDTPHSRYAKDREDTLLRPFKLIPNGVHHYDEYGLRHLEDEPFEIRKIHGEMIAFVLEWIKDWTPPQNSTPSGIPSRDAEKTPRREHSRRF